MEEIVTYLKKFQLAILIVIASIVVCVLLIKQAIPEVQKIQNIQADYISKSSQLADTERQLADLNNVVEKERAENCIKCGLCSKSCPQGLKIPELLSDILNEYEKAKASGGHKEMKS